MSHAGLAELVDALDSGSSVRKDFRVQVPGSAFLEGDFFQEFVSDRYSCEVSKSLNFYKFTYEWLKFCNEIFIIPGQTFCAFAKNFFERSFHLV